MADDLLQRAIALIQAGKIGIHPQNGLAGYGFDVRYQVMPGVGHAITKDGVNLTIDLFRKRIGQ